MPSLIIHKRILSNWKPSHEPKFTWHCNGTLTIFSFLFCFCQVHRFSTEHWFRWMRNSRFQLACARMNYNFILFYFMLLGALIVLGAKCVWSFVSLLVYARGTADLCCCMLSPIAQRRFLLAMFLHHWNCCIPQLMYEDPSRVRSGNDLRQLRKIELFFSLEYFCFTKLAVISAKVYFMGEIFINFKFFYKFCKWKICLEFFCYHLAIICTILKICTNF